MKELQVYFEGKDEVVDFVNRVSTYACEVDLRVGRFVVDGSWAYLESVLEKRHRCRYLPIILI